MKNPTMIIIPVAIEGSFTVLDYCQFLGESIFLYHAKPYVTWDFSVHMEQIQRNNLSTSFLQNSKQH